MRRTPALLAAAGLLLSGCGIEPTGVLEGGEAPTGVAPGVTLYFVDEHGRVRPKPTRSGSLGDVTAAVDLLLRVGDRNLAGLHSELPRVSSLGPRATVAGRTVTVALPLAMGEVGPRGVDQVVCTAIGVRRQSGAPAGTKVVLTFTDGSRTEPRACPAS
ncbi:hypothetical protein [Saccharopolyspora sp. CA-218241]|uniref:hypothetical protein n=1 Tax=Saccharopolyspora sp. CA-218241 TaxID=3240027 RepID=UPI003D955FBD